MKLGRTVIARLVPLALIVGGLVWAGLQMDWPAIGRTVATASLEDQLAMCLFWLAALFIRPLRLAGLLKGAAVDVERRYWPLWSGDVVGMATNSLVPMRAGELVMVYVLRRFLGMSFGKASSIVVLDRFFDLATVMAVCVSTLLAAPNLAPWSGGAAGSLVLALLLVAVGLWSAVRWRDRWCVLLERVLGGVLPSSMTGWKFTLRELVGGLGVLAQGHVLFDAFVRSVLLWACIILSFWFGIRAVAPDAPIAAGAFAASAVSLSFVLPLVPGGVGVFHGAVVLALSLYGIPAEASLAFAIVAHAFQVGSAIVLATVAALWYGIDVQSILRGQQIGHDSHRL